MPPTAITESYLIDGKASVPLSALRPEAWTPEDDDPDSGAALFGVRRARRAVGTLYRCVDIRAKAVSHTPFRIEQAGRELPPDDPTASALTGRLRRMLYLSEAALCTYAAAYWELGTNRVGLNLTPFWLAPQTVTPITTTAGIEGFRRTAPGGVAEFRQRVGRSEPPQFKGLLYTWLPGIEDELAPDIAPARVALLDAGVVNGLNEVLAAFFKRGMVKVTLLTVEGNPPAAEMEKVQSWWRRLVSGSRSAFRSVAVRASVKPTVIGEGVKDISAPGIRTAHRTGVAETMGVPQSLLMSEVLAGGTADAEMLGFYEFTVLPQCELIEAAFNEQYLSRLNMRMAFEPEKLAVRQAAELAKAEAVARLIPNQSILTLDEARALLGYGPMRPVQTPTADDEPIPAPPLGDEAALVTAKALERLRLARLVTRQVLAGKDGALTPWVSVVLTHREQQAIRDAVDGERRPEHAAAKALSAGVE